MLYIELICFIISIILIFLNFSMFYAIRANKAIRNKEDNLFLYKTLSTSIFLFFYVVLYIAIIFTVFLYAVTLAFEILMYKYSPGDANWIFVKLKILLSMIDANRIRAYLKIGVGTMSTITVIGGSYFGKKSLPNEIEDHERMIALYDKVEKEILESGEDREQLIYLAREFLTENSTWYSYQTQNNPDIVI